jgi:hypothetical protein
MTEINELLSELKGAILDINDELKKAFSTIRQLQADLAVAMEANASELKRGQKVMRDAAILVCHKQEQSYLDPSYAGGNSLNSFSERIACKSCTEVISLISLDDRP